jgi:hypothetical protein
MEARVRLLFAKMQTFLSRCFARSGPTHETNVSAKKRPSKQRHKIFRQAGDATDPLKTLRNFGALSKISEKIWICSNTATLATEFHGELATSDKMRTYEATPVFTIFTDLSCDIEFHRRTSNGAPRNVTIPAAERSARYSPGLAIPVRAVAIRRQAEAGFPSPYGRASARASGRSRNCCLPVSAIRRRALEI